ncbi:hypothetical protein ACFV4P_31015 [Kitasatospora sp. NPDC059795]|uniref:hypothetical protein n=1 Tax=Kitasatospora sp. NPDC059795 TaxID=3346949 RepID=UPI00365D3900
MARRLRVSSKSAYQWHKLWREGGGEALALRGPGGSWCRLSPRCLAELAAYLAQGPAADTPPGAAATPRPTGRSGQFTLTGRSQ